jgi:rhamnogalacturonyl hydrolase YesR
VPNSSSERDIRQALDTLAQARPAFWRRAACGVTRSLAPIPVLLDRNAYSADTARIRVLLLGGLSGRAADVDVALHTLELYAGGGDGLALRVALSAIPCGNPDGLRLDRGPDNGAGGNPSQGYPPEGNFYFDEQDPEKRYLWRWICFQAPDLVVAARAGDGSVRWEYNAAARRLAPALGASEMEKDSLLGALGQGHPEGLGVIPALRLTASEDQLPREISRLFGVVQQQGLSGRSPARQVLDRRRQRRRLEIARILANAYGHTFNPVVYTQGVPISGRLQLAQLDPDYGDQAPEIVDLLDDFVNGGLADGLAPSSLASVVWGDELTQATGDPRYAKLIIDAADRFQSAPPGQPPAPCDPDFRTEDMFMAGALLGRAHFQTGERRYVDILAQFLLDADVQQDNGLFWHCRSAPFYWGRGNGFAVLGLTETLTYLPEDHPARADITDMYLDLLDSLRDLQRQSGMLPQVLDFPGSYDEFTATCMLGYSIARGLRRGWLDAEWRPTLELAWQGVSERIDDVGNVVDACASTGVQQNVRDYLDRPAIYGFDDRSGGMALWFALEMERLARST